MSLTNASPYDAARAARNASYILAQLSESERNSALQAVHDALSMSKERILMANARDVDVAKGQATSAANESLVQRLDLSLAGKWEEMLRGILEVRDLEDPIGIVDRRTLLYDGLILERRSTPIGVILVVFEARPEVIANISALAIKSGNAAILKGGKESKESFIAISTVISQAIAGTMVPQDALQLVTTRDAVLPLLQFERYIDLVIPRGSKDLVQFVKDNTNMPVLGHADGLCCAYLRADCDESVALSVLLDAKTSYPAACNSIETLLVDERALKKPFPTIVIALIKNGVKLYCDPLSRITAVEIVKQACGDDITKAQELLEYIEKAESYHFETEFLSLSLAIRTVRGVDAALAHIHTYSSQHSEIILTNNRQAAEHFISRAGSASVFWNASSRIADGRRYGLGAEVGISTCRIHARGPVGLAGLTCHQWLVRGDGHAASSFGSSPGQKSWVHKNYPIITQSDRKLHLFDDDKLANILNKSAPRALTATTPYSGDDEWDEEYEIFPPDAAPNDGDVVVALERDLSPLD